MKSPQISHIDKNRIFLKVQLELSRPPASTLNLIAGTRKECTFSFLSVASR